MNKDAVFDGIMFSFARLGKLSGLTFENAQNIQDSMFDRVLDERFEFEEGIIDAFEGKDAETIILGALLMMRIMCRQFEEQ